MGRHFQSRETFTHTHARADRDTGIIQCTMGYWFMFLSFPAVFFQTCFIRLLVPFLFLSTLPLFVACVNLPGPFHLVNNCFCLCRHSLLPACLLTGSGRLSKHDLRFLQACWLICTFAKLRKLTHSELMQCWHSEIIQHWNCICR